MKQYAITQEQGNKILNYLADRPYREVCEFIEILQGLQPITFNDADK
jgi:hypothetical protein